MSFFEDSYTKQQAMMAIDEAKEAGEGKLLAEGAQKEEESFEEGLAGWRKKVESAPELVVFVARPLPQTVMDIIGKKARELFGSQLFLNFRIDPAVLAGAALAFGGRYKDFSLRVRLEEKKEELGEIYKSFLCRKIE